jgi:oligopeptide/dipeptide ABC transporter ATP-binding protein
VSPGGTAAISSNPQGASSQLLSVEGLQTHFATRSGVIKAVDGVSFSVDTGASLGIVGESGSGKSMTALSIMGLIDRPGVIAGGRILFKGEDLVGARRRRMERIRGREISMVFQDPIASLNPVYTVGRQIREVLQAHQDLTNSQAEERTLELLRMVRMPAPEQRIRAYPHNLSGGMCQRVTIAMGLANDPDLLILDEPTTALDATVQAQILDLVRELRTRVNTAILLITHDIAVASDMCTELVVMYGGRVMEQGGAAGIIERPRHPYSEGLLSSMPGRTPRGERLRPIPGSVPSPLAMPSGCPFAPRCPQAMAICATVPPLTTLDDGRQVACWLYPEVQAA